MTTSPRVARARTLVGSLDADITAAVATVRAALQPDDDSVEDHALAAIETFIVVALRVMAKTNPSKIQSVARTVEIAARLEGRQVLAVARDGVPA